MPDERTEVLIVGAGLAGLTAAVFLAWHGLRPVLVERHPQELIHPRARGINARSVEVFRQVGLEERLFAARGEGIVASDPDSSRMLIAGTLADRDADFVDLAPGSAEGVSPTEWCPIDQDRLEVILRDRARELGADVRYGVALTGLTEHPQGVTAQLREVASGAESTVEARYVVAADGQKSTVRRLLDLPVQGPGVLLNTLSMVIEADLDRVVAGRRFGFAYLGSPRQGTVIFPHDGKDRWCFGLPFEPDEGETVADYPAERCLELFGEAVGVPGLTGRLIPQLPDGTTVLPFAIGAYCAERFVHGRVLLAGDAARIVPPTGAFGGSTGIQDAHNLAWKLAAVVKGEAGPGLLATYDAERRAVSEFTMEQAMAQMVWRTGTASGEVDGMRVWDWWSVILGYRYRSTAVIPDPDGDEPDDGLPAVETGKLSAQPGTRAPHLTTGPGASTLDLYGRNFALVAGRDGASWSAAVVRACDELGLDLDFHLAGFDLDVPPAQWAERHGVQDDGAVLVRPDGFVAWRSRKGADPEGNRLISALSWVLARP
ncbi:FAD-dependent oxidoreductase [Kitasatospora aureofaciens]|uniref:FAD-dependent oxidoreductase n=1 Tax=Kitasatospora aureofaciens TaxID=1894 RepID=UPI001C473915|nr:FAD-dependent oxidoreductase [Kitasatospora aureofaciens]MBV6696715.1 FAD-dependent monooxygenase [Kitasatospora aureofaciens]